MTRILDKKKIIIKPITLKNLLNFSIPYPLFLSKHEQNLRRYLDVYV